MLASLFMLALLSQEPRPPARETSQTDTSIKASQALLQSGKPTEARESFESILNSDPNNVEAQQGEVASSERLALDARQTGHMDEALQSLLRAQGFAPKDPRLL